MRSKASFRGHPSHPALIPFPFAFLIGAFVFDVAGVWLNRSALWTTGAHLALAGVLTGLVAAIPGFIDYMYTVPPNSTGKKRATKHMILNLSAIALFALVWWLRGAASVQPDLLLLGGEGIATIALLSGGWMGGTLVSRNQISVDHRYANAGKWKEEHVDAPKDGEPVTVNTDGLEVNQMRLLRIGDKRIVLGRTEKGFVAFDDHCTHRGGSLAGGAMICGTVQCPWHGSQFDVTTGAVKSGPAKESISAYRVELSDGKVKVLGVSGSASSEAVSR
jgi:nitrite reductase/ring-hydroxylating ferredoxin subunit/uncharacterized membrane protein